MISLSKALAHHDGGYSILGLDQPVGSQGGGISRLGCTVGRAGGSGSASFGCPQQTSRFIAEGTSWGGSTGATSVCSAWLPATTREAAWGLPDSHPRGIIVMMDESAPLAVQVDMERVLVNGAGGFIGGHLVKRLKAEGFWVRAVDLKRHEFSDPLLTNSFKATCATRRLSAM